MGKQRLLNPLSQTNNWRINMANDRIKHVLEGAAIQVVPKTLSNFGCNELAKNGISCNATVPVWYDTTFNIPNDDLILDLGLPVALGGIGMATKKQAWKDMALGAAIAGVGTLLNVLFTRGFLTLNASARTNSQSPALATGISRAAMARGYPPQTAVYPVISPGPDSHANGAPVGMMVGEISSKWRAVTEAQTTPIQRQIYAGRKNESQLLV
jgi:hypothetical protein